MNILLPMAGAGQRFAQAGYKTSKPLIPLTSRFNGEQVPMVVAAISDLPHAKDQAKKILVIDRDFHKEQGVEDTIQDYFPNAQFLTLKELTEGQASTCLLGKSALPADEELIIGACDNGMDANPEKFDQLRKKYDALIFTYRNHDLVLENPKAHGWVKITEDGSTVTGMSVKQPISDNPMNDHAVVGAFWFRKAADFFRLTEKMIDLDDRINYEFYVDKVFDHFLKDGLNVGVFELERYHCWGTPRDYENYENTLKYWRDFASKEFQ